MRRDCCVLETRVKGIFKDTPFRGIFRPPFPVRLYKLEPVVQVASDNTCTHLFTERECVQGTSSHSFTLRSAKEQEYS